MLEEGMFSFGEEVLVTSFVLEMFLLGLCGFPAGCFT